MPPSGVRHFRGTCTASSITALGTRNPALCAARKRLDLGDRHRTLVAGPGDIGPTALAALALAGQGHGLADGLATWLAERFLGDHPVDRSQEHERETVPVHRLAAILGRAGDQSRGRGAAHQILDGPLHVLAYLPPRRRVAVRQERRARQPGHGHGVRLAAADDPGAVVGLAGGQVVEPLQDGPERLRRHVFGQDFLSARGRPSHARTEGRRPATAAARQEQRDAIGTLGRSDGHRACSSAPPPAPCPRAWDEPRTVPGARPGPGSPGTSTPPAACAASRRRRSSPCRGFPGRPARRPRGRATIGPSSTRLSLASRSALVRASAIAFS